MSGVINFNTEDSNNVDYNTAESNTVDSNTADSNTADSNTADSNTADSNTADVTNQPEQFTNDLPYELENKSMKLLEVEDYNDVLQKMSLDNDVIKQHNQYVNDRNKLTSTASNVPDRSDTQDIVTRWGLSRVSYIPIDSSAREIPSQDPEQGSKPIKLTWK